MFIIQINRGQGWFIGACPITTYYQTQDQNKAIKFASYEAAISVIQQYFAWRHDAPQNINRWTIKYI